MTPRWMILADDLTGACDTGAAFAVRWKTRVALDPGAGFADAQVQVLTTESRALPEADAVRAVVRALANCSWGPETLFYKKIDSTLRGHPAAELRPLIQALGIQAALITPAFPDQGRVVRGGRVWVGGTPLEDLPVAREVAEPDLLRLFGPDAAALPLDAVRQDEEALSSLIARSHDLLVADAETAGDLRAIAQAALRTDLRLFCGSAGLARALVAVEEPRLPGCAKPGEFGRHFSPASAPVLVVSGSRHPATAGQVKALEQKGASVCSLNEEDLRIVDAGSGISAAIQRLSMALNSGMTAVLSAARLGDKPGGEQVIAAHLAALAAGAIAQAPVGGVVLTGGDTAAAVLRALNCRAVDLGGEVMPGLGWGWLADGPYEGLPLVTKAGGFGREDALLKAVRFIRSKRPG